MCESGVHSIDQISGTILDLPSSLTPPGVSWRQAPGPPSTGPGEERWTRVHHFAPNVLKHAPTVDSVGTVPERIRRTDVGTRLGHRLTAPGKCGARRRTGSNSASVVDAGADRKASIGSYEARLPR